MQYAEYRDEFGLLCLGRNCYAWKTYFARICLLHILDVAPENTKSEMCTLEIWIYVQNNNRTNSCWYLANFVRCSQLQLYCICFLYDIEQFPRNQARQQYLNGDGRQYKMMDIVLYIYMLNSIFTVILIKIKERWLKWHRHCTEHSTM